LVFAGGGLEIKGAGVLLEALPEILRQVPRLRVLIAGAGEKQFLNRFRDFSPQVEVLGWVPFREMPILYGAADLVTVPSTCHESFSLVTVESMRVGTPVVGSNFGGIAELIRDGEDGYLFPVGDAEMLAHKVIAHFTRPPVERRHMRQACVQAARTRHTLESHVDGILNVYREALS
jgi:glycosyltransferase involved in cell wall biosynthesis